MLPFRRAEKVKVRRCATCGDEIQGKGVEKDGKLFCNPWHANRYQPPPPWWKRIFEDRNPAGGVGGCCG
jgi:hypothetical protein